MEFRKKSTENQRNRAKAVLSGGALVSITVAIIMMATLFLVSHIRTLLLEC